MVNSKKDSYIGQIPDDWVERSWGEVLEGFKTGITPSRKVSDYFNGKNQWFTSGELKKHYIYNSIEKISDKAVDDSNIVIHPAGTFVMAIIGLEAVGTRGSCALLGCDGAINQSCVAIYGTEKVSSEYLYHYYSQFGEKLDMEFCQGTKQQNLSADIIKNFPICYPSKTSEQQAIVEALSDIDTLIENTEKLIKKKKGIRQGVIQELLTGNHRLPGFSNYWKTFKFSDVFDFLPNNAFTRAQMADSGKVKNIHYGDILTKYGPYIKADSSEIPYIDKEVDLSRFADRCYLQSGDVIIADTAEDETVGKALEVVDVECPILAGQHTLLCRPKIQFAHKFMGYYLNSSCYHDQLLPYIVGTKVSSISRASVALTKLFLPEYKEQKAIASILSDMDDEINELEKKLEKYKQVKQGMKEQLLTGKIRLV